MKEYLINCLKSLNLDHISKRIVDENKDIPSSSTFAKYFGNWGKAIEAANLKTGKITGRPQDEKIIIPDHLIEIINGELLGDGCIYLSGSYKTNGCFCHSTKNIEYGKYLYNKLKEIPLLKPEITKRDNQFRTRSTTNIAWTEIYNKWYVNGKKIVPDDIVLTKETCRHWYLGDGYFEKTCKISTCGFTKEEVEKLAYLLTTIGFKAAANKRSGGYYVIRLSRYSYLDFLNWIDGFTKGYEHRWNQ